MFRIQNKINKIVFETKSNIKNTKMKAINELDNLTKNKNKKEFAGKRRSFKNEIFKFKDIIKKL